MPRIKYDNRVEDISDAEAAAYANKDNGRHRRDVGTKLRDAHIAVILEHALLEERTRVREADRAADEAHQEQLAAQAALVAKREYLTKEILKTLDAIEILKVTGEDPRRNYADWTLVVNMAGTAVGRLVKLKHMLDGTGIPAEFYAGYADICDAGIVVTSDIVYPIIQSDSDTLEALQRGHKHLSINQLYTDDQAGKPVVMRVTRSMTPSGQEIWGGTIHCHEHYYAWVENPPFAETASPDDDDTSPVD
jgi:hypothetical protein